jgi:regulatory protein
MAVPLSHSSRSAGSRRPAPLDQAALERLALRYVERFATTRGKLSAYLARKIRERGWEGPATDPAAVAERMATLGYVDDRGFADQKGAALGRRGYGARRVAETLRAAGLDADDAASAVAQARASAWESALHLARRKRIGPMQRSGLAKSVRCCVPGMRRHWPVGSSRPGPGRFRTRNDGSALAKYHCAVHR